LLNRREEPRSTFAAWISDEIQIHLETIWSSWVNEEGHQILRNQEKKINYQG
jgi:hypothetical protein